MANEISSKLCNGFYYYYYYVLLFKNFLKFSARLLSIYLCSGRAGFGLWTGFCLFSVQWNASTEV